MSDEGEAKTEDASPKKLRKQKERGSVPKTADMAAILHLVVGLGVFLLGAEGILADVEQMFDDSFAGVSGNWQSSIAQTTTTGRDMLIGLLFMISGLSIAAVSLVTVLYHGGLPFSVTPLAPDLNRLNPATGFVRVFGQRSWIELGLQALRLLIWSALSGLILWGVFDHLFRIDLCGALCAAGLVREITQDWLGATLGLCVALLGAEFLVQKKLFLSEQKMSKSDVKREQKEQTGAPELRQARRRLQRELLASAGSTSKNDANFAFHWQGATVGIRYDPQKAPVPRVTARATGAQGVQLRRFFEDRRLPMAENEAVVTACLNVAPGSPIPEASFSDVATAIGQLIQS